MDEKVINQVMSEEVFGNNILDRISLRIQINITTGSIIMDGIENILRGWLKDIDFN